MKSWLLLFALCSIASAAWLEHVSPIMTADEKKAYASLQEPSARDFFENNFWSGKQITADEYDRRIAYVQSVFGSANNDRARVYLSLGPPVKISRLASTRSFWPLEIWYYDTAPNIGFSPSISLMFYQKNQTGPYRIYSPTLDGFPALLNPQGGTRGMFRVNDILTEDDIRKNMNLSPAEWEIADAALRVARGVTGSENEQLIGRATSPETALSKTAKFRVSTRLLAANDRPVLTTFQSWSDDGNPVIDLFLETRLKSKIGLAVSVEESETTVPSFEGRKVHYQHRLFLLPGTYTLTFTIDGLPVAYPLTVQAARQATALLPGRPAETNSTTPFEFGTTHWAPSAGGPQVFAQVPRAQTVKWMLRQNAATVWSAETVGPLAIAAPIAPPGKYTLEMRTADETRECSLQIGPEESPIPVISYNANLSPDQRARSLGRQWLARGNLVEARTWLNRARAIQPSDALTVDLARVSAMTGDLDSPRPALSEILQRTPDSFEALTLLGYIEAQLQDYTVAAQYYERALSIRNSPIIAEALAHIDTYAPTMHTNMYANHSHPRFRPGRECQEHDWHPRNHIPGP